ncbi:MAG: hypothetical protein L0Z73_14960 [Gammaproteobacteria bacterium]|nr:hypothetical protein [Gammaproteobacteria bacterium]
MNKKLTKIMPMIWSAAFCATADAADSYRYFHVTIDTPWAIFIFLLMIILFPFVLSAVLYWYFIFKKHKEEKESKAEAEPPIEERQ